MARIATPMNWTELKRSRARNRFIGSVFSIAGLGVSLIVVLRWFFDVGSDRLLSPMFIKLGLPQLAVAIITPVLGIPGIQPLWELDFRYGYLVVFGFISMSTPFWLLAKQKSQTMRNAAQRAQEDHLTHQRLGYPRPGYPQPPNIVNVTARGDIRESVIGTGSGANVAINSAHNSPPLPEIAELVSRMYTHLGELALTPAQLRQVEAHLRTAQEQLVARTPNHPLLRMSLSSIQHIVEIGTAHALVGHWRDILHALQRITGS